jgi:transcriptional regulator with XRE-family HTH domain
MTTNFGQALAAERQEQRLSQRVLADRVGVRQTAVAQWEQGRTTPSKDHVFTLERVLGLAPGALAYHLGFGPPTTGHVDRLPGVIDTLQSDRSLNDQSRHLLIELYQLLRVASRPPRTSSTRQRTGSDAS